MRKTFMYLPFLLCSAFSCSDSESVRDPNPSVPQKPLPDKGENPEFVIESGIEPGGYEWDNYPVSVMRPKGTAWVLQGQSDEFKEDIAPVATAADLGGKWKNFYHAPNWHGPAPTYWQHDHVWIEDGMMKIKATRPEEAKEIILTVESGGRTRELPATFTGCATATERVKYPVYVEARVKLSNSTMASDVWLLSPDDTQEIDIVEAYGGDRNIGDNDKFFYGNDRIHLSHHVFIRDPFQDYQPQMPQTWHKDDQGTIWRDDFHTYGVFWRDPNNLEYYIDGKLVRRTTDPHIDPLNYTQGTGLNKEMDIIINMEDQSWRALDGLSPTDEELQNQENCTMLVDWIRVYQLEAETTSQP